MLVAVLRWPGRHRKTALLLWLAATLIAHLTGWGDDLADFERW